MFCQLVKKSVLVCPRELWASPKCTQSWRLNRAVQHKVAVDAVDYAVAYANALLNNLKGRAYYELIINKRALVRVQSTVL